MELTQKYFGPEVPTAPALLPSNATPLEGKYVTLEGLTKEHVPGLFANLGLPNDESVFDWIPMDDIPKTAEVLWSELEDLCKDDKFVAYVIKADPEFLSPRPGATGGKHTEVLGLIGYGEFELKARIVEIGAALFSKKVQRTAASTEVHYLLLRNVFEPAGTPDSLPFRRVAWRTNSLNKASRHAAERVGYVYEGTWRKNMIWKGRSRDTAWFSMIDDEWPAAKDALEQWLDERNFREDGTQIQKLQDIRAAAASRTS